MREILCPLCGKAVGVRIPDGSHDSGGLGVVTMYKSKYDHRSASHVWWSENRKNGTLCRKCARGKFPTGEYWVVLHRGVKGWDLCAGGDSGSPYLYTSESAAAARVDELTMKFGPLYKAERRKI